MKAKTLLSLVLAASPAWAALDLPIADFEGKDYAPWQVEGEAFGAGPANGAWPGQMPVEGFGGKGLVNSFAKGDGGKGVLTSPEFKLERRYVRFLVGGGGFAGKTCVNLLVDGKPVRTATGPNTEPGGSEMLAPQQWDVAEFAGRPARIQIVDDATGSWGHINVDEIFQTDTPPVATVSSRELKLDARYVLFPVKTLGERARRERVSVVIDGKVVRDFDIELSEKPEWFAHLDVSAWQGKTATIQAPKIQPGNRGLELVQTSAALWDEGQIYRESLRSQLHFSPRRGWLNDPNGMVYANGEYHLYFQHNPYGWHWGNMHWGHAVSRDLVHWEELPIALYPVRHGDWVFSGSAVVDRQNSSGWKQGTNDVIVGSYTSTGRGECMVYSNDHGRTWTEYEGNPVVKHDGRDPRLLWHEPSKQWVMAVYTEDGKAPKKEDRQAIAFYTSPDLKQWTYQSRIGGFFECPDLFELAVDGKADARKWVLLGASSEYMIGSFDGKVFSPETPKLPGHRGNNFYAAQTFSHDPQGRVVQVGWLRAPSPGMPFNQAMSLPLELGLKSTPAGPRLSWTPVKEVEKLRQKVRAIMPTTLSPGELNPWAAFQAELMEVVLDFAPAPGAVLNITARGIPIRYDGTAGQLTVAGHKTNLPLHEGRQRLRFLVDRTCVELFAHDGTTYVPVNAIPKAEARGLEIEAIGGKIDFRVMDAFELGSIWDRKGDAPEAGH